MEKLEQAIEGVLRNRILFIGGDQDTLPTISHKDGVQVYTGCPADIIKELTKAAKEAVGK